VRAGTAGPAGRRVIAATAYAGRRVGVLGLARSGMAAARALAAGGAEPVLWDDSEAARAAAAAGGWRLADLSRPREAATLAALIVSPGIPHLFPEAHPAILAAEGAGVPVDNDIGLWFPALTELVSENDGPAPRIVAITGSNGKSTTTALVAHLVATTGRPVQMGGNIGRAVFDLAPPAPGEILVIELSSYQIELARALAPDIAVFLNLSTDHLDRHGGLGGYFAAKRRLFEQGAPATSVVGLDDRFGRFLANALPEGVLPFATTMRLRERSRAIFMAGDHLAEWRDGRQIGAADLRDAPALMGRHNHQNACAAWGVARRLGLGPKAIAAGFASFPGLAHRTERLGTVAGALVINDSKATNAEAAGRALSAFDRVRWIAGGRAKEGGIDCLAPLFGRIAHAYLIGEAAAGFARALGDTPHSIAGDLATATARALADAAPGEVILLSPAAASFDQFRDFEARGEAFRALVVPHLEDGS